MIWQFAQEAVTDPVKVNGWVLLGGWVTTITVAIIGSWQGSKRAVNKHGNDELAMGDAIRAEMELMRRAQTATNELVAQFADASARRTSLLERRLDLLENEVRLGR